MIDSDSTTATAPSMPAQGASASGDLPGQVSNTDVGALWRPYVDPPLLTPHMTLGLEYASTTERARLQRFLAALVATRPGPVHVNVAFNACYFGFDLTTRSYVGGALNDLFAFPTVDVTSAPNALPVGALINITAGAHPLFAEVTYKEGAHPQLGEDGALPDWLSGAPAGVTGPSEPKPPGNPEADTLLRERLVVDVDAFGADLSVSPEQLARIRRQGRGLDSAGHLLLDARYRSRAEADLDDVGFYARYLLSTGRNQLLSASAPMPLRTTLTDDAGETGLEAALIGLLQTVEQALADIAELRLWRGYAFTRASLGARLGDGGPLGGSDLNSIAAQLGRQAIPSPGRRFGKARTVAYTAIGPRLRHIDGAGPLLSGVGYALAVCHANAVVSDYARREVDDITELLPGGVHLRLDDPWQGGGVWRSEHPDSAWVRVDVTQPLGLGWLGTIPGAVDLTAPAPDSTAQPEPGLVPQPEPPLKLDEEDGGAGDASGLTVTDSQISWTQPLRLRHQLQQRLPLPDAVASQMRGSYGPARLRLLLTHDGYDLDMAQAQQDTRTELYGPTPELAGIDWPLEFFPGIRLICTWPRGGSVVRATSTLLDAPVIVDGFEIEHRYDPWILTRDSAPGAPQRGAAGARTSTGAAGTLTLTDRILRAVRRLGLLDREGRAALARTSLPAAVYGTDEHDHAADAALDEAAAQLLVAGDLLADVAGVSAAGQLQYPADPSQPTCPVLVYAPHVVVGVARPRRQSGVRSLDPRLLRTTDVSGHLRHIAHLGREASDEARANYRADRARFGLLGPVELPPGFTYVSPFQRGV